jgi:prevent-host-death family protein
MLDITQDIRSLSEFKRETLVLLRQMKDTSRPLVLTVNGKAELVVQDAASYQRLLERLETIEGIRRGLRDVKAGRSKALDAAFSQIRKSRGLSR